MGDRGTTACAGARPAGARGNHRAGFGEDKMTAVQLASCQLPASQRSAVCALLAGPRAPSAAEPLFIEAAAETGLSFTHVNGASGQYYMAEVMGAGVALFDYDSDGDLDVFLVQGGQLGEVGQAWRQFVEGQPAFSQRPLGGCRWRPQAALHGRHRARGRRRERLRNGRGRRGLRQRRRSRSVRDLFRTGNVVPQQRRRHIHGRDERGGRQRSRSGAPARRFSTTTATAIWICSSPTTWISRSRATSDATMLLVPATTAAPAPIAPFPIVCIGTTAPADSQM